MSKNTIKINLDKIADVVAGQSPKSIHYSSNEGVPFLQGNRTFGALYPTIDTYTKKVTKLASKGDVLISVRAPVGDLNFAHCDLCIGRGLASIRAKDGDNNFVYYALKFNLKKLLKKGTGTTFDSINKDTLEDLEIIIPETKIDRFKISKTLSNIDAKIELNNHINAELEKIAKTIYDYWFVQFDFPDANGKPYKSSGGEMIYDPMLKMKVPEKWKVGTLKDISELIRGVSYDSADIKNSMDIDVIPVLRATNLTKNIIDLENMVYVPTKNVNPKQILKKYDILITMSSGSKEHIGKNGFFYYDKIITFGAFCAKLVADDEFKYYLYSYTQSDFMSTTIKNECLGTNINNLNGTLVAGFKIVIPPVDLLKMFNSKVSAVYEKIGNNLIENEKLTELRDWLLPMLMNGQVKVS